MRLKSNWSVRAKLQGMVLLLALAMVLVGVVAALALTRTQAVTAVVVRQTAALSLLQAADMSHDGLRSVVYAALLVGQVPEVTAEAVRKDAHQHSRTIREAMQKLAVVEIDADLHAALLASRPAVDRYLDGAEAMIDAALVDRRLAQAQLAAFNAEFDHLLGVFEGQVVALRDRNLLAIARADQVKSQADLLLAATALISLFASAAMVGWIGQSIRRSLRRVETVASAVAAGELDRRTVVEVDDEVGRLGGAVNAMADKLRTLLDQALADSERHSFSRELGEALEMADSEPAAYRVVQRAMQHVSPSHAMELLVADSSHAVLQRATEHPIAGAPGCTVDSPFSCQAVRSGSTVSFHDSEALNACPRMRGRASAAGSPGGLSAVCVPLHFMGRALGVLHATGAVGEVLAPQRLAQLTALGNQAAARIGVVRAFERTQLQAATDPATGLVNRRALEAAVHEFMRRKQPFALVMADLDKFKLLNDTYGHLVGDEALRLFADAMKRCVRDEDTVARYGGEEFALVLAGSTARDGMAWADRARARLVKALDNGRVPRFTASFGIADSTMAEHYEDLLRIADEALYRSKEQGRDRATAGSAFAANEPMTRQASEHTERIDVERLSVML
jgi:diguanylate cyclase (GGDEF)-like protein